MLITCTNSSMWANYHQLWAKLCLAHFPWNASLVLFDFGSGRQNLRKVIDGLNVDYFAKVLPSFNATGCPSPVKRSWPLCADISLCRILFESCIPIKMIPVLIHFTRREVTITQQGIFHYRHLSRLQHWLAFLLSCTSFSHSHGCAVVAIKQPWPFPLTVLLSCRSLA